MKVSATLKGKPDQYSRYVIYIRRSEGKKRKFKATKMRVLKTQFKKGKVINHPAANEYNTKIKKLVFEAEQKQAQEADVKKTEFIKYANKCVDHWEKTQEKEEGTIKGYRSQINKLSEFRSSFLLSDLNSEFFKAYKEYLITKRENENNTVVNAFKFLSIIIEEAILDKLIVINPLDTYRKPTYKDPPKEYLTIDQVKALDKTKLSPELRFIAVWFLICCYTGFRFGDTFKFDRKKHIRNGRIVVTTEKTGEPVSIPISPKVSRYLAEIKYHRLDKTNQYVNRALKTIFEKAEITGIHVTYHTSRHTFGTLCASLGISQEVVAKLLGHRSLKHTAIYYKLASPRIDKEIKKLG